MLARRLRQRANINPALGEYIVFVLGHWIWWARSSVHAGCTSHSNWHRERWTPHTPAPESLYYTCIEYTYSI